MSTVSTVMPRETHVGTFLRAVGKTVRNLWIAYISWRLEQFAIRQLRSMGDRELNDMGIPRAEIESAVKGAALRRAAAPS